MNSQVEYPRIEQHFKFFFSARGYCELNEVAVTYGIRRLHRIVAWSFILGSLLPSYCFSPKSVRPHDGSAVNSCPQDNSLSAKADAFLRAHLIRLGFANPPSPSRGRHVQRILPLQGGHRSERPQCGEERGEVRPKQGVE